MKLVMIRIFKKIGIFFFEALAVVAKKFSALVYKGLYIAEWIGYMV